MLKVEKTPTVRHFQAAEVDVLVNSKTKLYTDGTTNMIACSQAIFKDPNWLSEQSIKNDLYNDMMKMERAEKLARFLHDNDIEFDEFLRLANMQIDENFERYLNELQISVHEWDVFCEPYRRFMPQNRTNSLDDPRHDSVKRAKDQIFDYILNNDFDYFFTGTINPEQLDSKDPKALLKPVTKWLKNMVQRYNMSYVMIAERHKKGGIHFHGLFKADGLRLEDSGTKLYKGHKKPVSNERAERLGLTNGRTVYNLKSWSFGFSTCIALTGDRMNTAFYVTKYITKDCRKIFGKFFWHSRNLKKPVLVYKNVDYDSIESGEFNGYKYVFRRGVENDSQGDIADVAVHLQPDAQTGNGDTAVTG